MTWFPMTRLALLLFCALYAKAQAPPPAYSSTAEYQKVLRELHEDHSRPSRISAGTLLEATAATPVGVKTTESSSELRLETEAWRITFSKASWSMTLTNKLTQLTWQMPAGPGAEAGVRSASGATGSGTPGHLERVTLIAHHNNVWEMQVGSGTSTPYTAVTVTVLSPTIIRLALRSRTDGNAGNLDLHFAGAGPFFGLGERFSEMKLDGLKTVLRPEDLLTQPGHNWTYIPIPFLVTPQGLGLYLDTATVSSFDLSQADQKKFSVSVEEPTVDAYFFVGTPKEIVGAYTALTGRTPVPPPWTFGPWICAYQGPYDVLRDARRLRKEGIPASAIWTFDVMGKGDVMGWPLWWTGYYPNIRALTDELHNLGFKAMTYLHPYVRSVQAPYNLENPVFAEGKAKKWFVLNAAGEPTGPAFEPYVDGNVDFTNPQAVDWWEQRLQEILVKDNFDGWMEDYGEWVNETDQFAAGVTGHRMANLNPLLYHKITYEISRKAKPDVVGFVRSGYAGSQGYSRVVWGGDQFPTWDHDSGLQSVVRAGITAGLSGYAVWGPDIAENGHSKELWIRWTEFAALTPVMRDHMWDKPEDAVNLWYDAQTTDVFRRYAKLHTSLFPYLYTYANEAAKTGVPIMRHPLLEFPADPKTYDTDGEYLLGEKMLVAPVVEPGASTRSLYLPEGSWVDYWTGEEFEGRRQVTVTAPLEHIPLLVRAGSVLPSISADTETLAQDLASPGTKDLSGSTLSSTGYRTWGNDLIWRVFPAPAHADESFTLFDGTKAEAIQDRTHFQVVGTGSPVNRQYEVVLPLTERPKSVKLDGQNLPGLDDNGSRLRKTGWWLDRGSATLHLFFLQKDFRVEIVR